jgi:hypothetical protein
MPEIEENHAAGIIIIQIADGKLYVRLYLIRSDVLLN